MTVRLNVNIGDKVAAALKDLAAANDLNMTEAVRRAVSIWVWAEQVRADGGRLAVLSEDGATVREVTFL